MKLEAFSLYLHIIGYITHVHSAKVVTFPFPATSYVRKSQLVSQELQKLGHTVTMVLPEYISHSERFHFSGVSTLTYKWYGKQDEDRFDQMITTGIYDIGNIIDSFYYHNELADEFLSDDNLFRQLAEKDFDFAVLGGADEFRFLANFPKNLSLPFVVLGVGYDLWSHSTPFFPSFTPSVMSTLTDRMSFTERIYNTLVTGVVAGFSWMSEVYFNNKYGIPPHRPITAEAELWIVETDPVLDYPAPSMPNLKTVGGISIEKAKSLPAELESFMNKSKGVIYMSFGSLNRRFIQENEKDLLINVFSDLQYSIVWKTEEKINSIRILTKPWLPQNDILGHPKTKLFISSCGRNSQQESIYHAVPLLCIPFRDDQFYNSVRSEYKGFSRTIDIQDINVVDLKNTIEQLIRNESYITNVTRASTILKSRNKLPSERAAYWIDHVIKFGGSYMRSGGQKLTWFQFLTLDVIGILLLVNVLIFLLFRNCLFNIVEKRYTDKEDTDTAMNGKKTQ